MNREELKKTLAQRGVRKNSYDLDENDSDECYDLEKNGKNWDVYYRERGVKTGIKTCQSENEACNYIYELLENDPSTR